MSNAKVLNCSTSIRHPTTTATIRGAGDYNLRQTTNVNRQNSFKHKTMANEMIGEKTTTTTTTATQKVKEIKKLNANNLSPLNSPQLIRSTRARVAENNGWNNSIKVKSSCSSGSNSVESIVPKYQIATNASVLSQKRSYLNQTTTVNKLTNKTMNMRNDKSKKEINENSSTQKSIENGSLKKKTVSPATAKKLLKSTFPSSSSPTKAFSAKFPNGLPFENEFYHYRKNNHRSSVASDSTTSNNSSDDFANNQRLSNSPYQDEFRRNPSNDALYVDFTLKSFERFDSDEEKCKKKIINKSTTLSTKTKYILTDKNCFYEIETSKSSNSSIKSNESQQQVVDFMTAQTSKRVERNAGDAASGVVYVTSANIFPKCNRPQTDNGIGQAE
ncbi:CLUMA_CG019183, isoform A [Clunio marinus]|uniref:CLUMA_CG019183, isoform A n=1 Tax=Clunio marinus TaxID=568069 RepID=A0A1J1J0T2_9DIPT|nr:CLUMA_CG019183, isoform A [Clunio marinus]